MQYRTPLILSVVVIVLLLIMILSSLAPHSVNEPDISYLSLLSYTAVIPPIYPIYIYRSIYMFSLAKSDVYLPSKGDLSTMTGKLVLFLFCLTLVNGDELLRSQLNQIDDFLEAFVECQNLTGLSLAITRGQEVLVAKGYGVADLDTGRPIDGDTLFGIASVTKAFTAALLAILMERHEG